MVVGGVDMDIAKKKIHFDVIYNMSKLGKPIMDGCAKPTLDASVCHFGLGNARNYVPTSAKQSEEGGDGNKSM